MTNSKENQVKSEPERKKRENTTRKVIPHTKAKVNKEVKEERTKTQKMQPKQMHKQSNKKENRSLEQRANKPERGRKKNTKLKEDVRIKKSPLKVIPLGGLLEIGKNLTVFEYENEIIIVDCRTCFSYRRYAWSRFSCGRYNIFRKKQRQNKRTCFNTWS